MIYSLNGTLIAGEPGMAVVECGGVGYKCLTTLQTSASLPKTGQQVFLYTYLNLREDAADLFGFFTREELEKIWERFYRREEDRSGRGTGLGLAITRQIVELHGGRCRAENIPGGVRFPLRVPH